jgi:hypothetical protein
MDKKALAEHIKKLSELKDLKAAIQLTLKNSELMEKAVGDEHWTQQPHGMLQPKGPAAPVIPNQPKPFAVVDPKPQMAGQQPMGLKMLTSKPEKHGHILRYNIGQPGGKNHYRMEFDMTAPKNPWSVQHVQSSDGSVIGRSPNAHSSEKDAIPDIVHHFKSGQWKV